MRRRSPPGREEMPDGKFQKRRRTRIFEGMEWRARRSKNKQEAREGKKTAKTASENAVFHSVFGCFGPHPGLKWPIVAARSRTTAHLPPKLAQHSFHMASTCLQHRPTRPQLGPSLAPTSPPHSSTWPPCPTWPTMAPTWSQHTPMPQRWPKMTPTWRQHAPKMAQDGPHRPPPLLSGRWPAVRRQPLSIYQYNFILMFGPSLKNTHSWYHPMDSMFLMVKTPLGFVNLIHGDGTKNSIQAKWTWKHH